MLLPSQLALRNRISHLVTILILLTVFQAWWSSSTQAQLLNDQAIRITSISDAQQRRQQLITYIWGTGGFPSTTRLPVRTLLSGPPPDLTPTGVPLKNLERVDKLTVTMDGPVGEPPLNSIAYHLIPQRKNNRLVIMNPGHACSYTEQVGSPDSDDGYGDLRTLNALLHEGYSVLATYMPNFQPGACEIDGTAINHNDLMTKTVRIGTGSPLKWFFEPVVVSLNYLHSQYSVDQFPQYEEYDFVGLSGGGWTAVVFAAIDPSIQVTISISGSIPLYLRSGGSIGDSEQTIQSFYSIAGYPELYVLGSLGANRRQIQVLNRRDNCCFSEWQHTGPINWQEAMRNTERDVRTALFNLGSTTGAGFFRLEIDDSTNHHGISWHTIVNTITAELNYGRRLIGAASTNNVFVRGLNGNLWHYNGTVWTDTSLPMVGVPAVIEGAIHDVDVFYRDPGNFVMHAYRTGSQWTAARMGGQIEVDPVVAKYGKNPVFVAGLGGDYRLYYWSLPGNGTYQSVNQAFQSRGQPALVATSTAVYIYARGFDGRLYQLTSNSGSMPTSWTQELVGGDNTDFPSATQIGNTSLVYVRGVNTNRFWEASKTGSGNWVWSDISAATSAPPLLGSPSVSVNGSTVHVAGRDTSGNLVRFSKGASWAASTTQTVVSGSPLAIASQVFVRGNSGRIWRFDGTNWVSLGGLTYP